MSGTYGKYDRDLLVAIHEAGHAVICHVLGYDFVSVTIEKNEATGSDGAFKRSPVTEAKECGRLSELDQRKWMCDKIKITLAGGLAVHKITGDEKTMGIEPDLISAWNVARMFLKDEDKATELNTALSALTIDLLRNERTFTAITELANSLIRQRTLNYNDAVGIIEKTFSEYDLKEKS